MKESEKIALASVVIFVIVALVFIIIFQREANFEKELKYEKEKSYIEGYVKGKEDGANQVMDLIKENNEKLRDKYNN